MEETIQSALTPITIAALAGIFIIVLVCSQRALKEMPFFGDGPTWILAFCVVLLSVLGIVQFFGSPEQSTPAREESKKPGGLLDFVLLPYVVLALSILLVLLLAAIERLGHRRKAPRLPRISHNRKTIAKLRIPEDNDCRTEKRAYGPSDRELLMSRSGRKRKGSRQAR